MIIERSYYFKKEDYNIDGFNKYNNELFTDFIRECETDFHNQTLIFFANCFYANDSTMILIKKCHYCDENEDFGMDLIEGEIDEDTNLAIEKYSKRKTVYAISSVYSLDEPIFLIIDDKIRDGKFILKYIPNDDEDNEDIDTNPPIGSHRTDIVPSLRNSIKNYLPYQKEMIMLIFYFRYFRIC